MNYPNMVLVVVFNKGMCVKIVVAINLSSRASCPSPVLRFTSVIIVVVDEAQYHTNPILFCFRNHKIQSLHTHT